MFAQRERPSQRLKNIITPLRGVKVQPKKLGKIEELDSESTATLKQELCNFENAAVTNNGYLKNKKSQQFSDAKFGIYAKFHPIKSTTMQGKLIFKHEFQNPCNFMDILINIKAIPLVMVLRCMGSRTRVLPHKMILFLG